MPGDEADRVPGMRQDVGSGRDSYASGLNQAIINFSSGARQSATPPRRIWGNVPARNLGFTGREELLGAVRQSLVSGDRAVVQALHGLGGIGKTQLAIEYAHRYAPEYDIVWWIPAEQPQLIGEQFAALATAIGCTDPGAGVAAARTRTLSELRERDLWLLVFDNAENAEDITQWLPGGTGHVLVTSRTHGWDEIAVPVQVDVMARSESVALLRRRVPGLDAAGADQVAEAVGDLPLAVAQAAGYMSATGTPVAGYVALLEARAAEVMDRGRPPSYPRSLAAVTQVAFDRLNAEDPAAAQVVRICAFLAPEPVPARWFSNVAGSLPEPLGAVTADELAWGEVLTRIKQQALARIDQHGLLMHRLTQVIIRSRLSPDEVAATQAQAAALLAASHPGDEDLPATWPGWARLLPHLPMLTTTASTEVLSDLAHDAVWYLIRRGDAPSGHQLASRLHRHHLAQDGPDDPRTLEAENTLAAVLHQNGQAAEARELHEDVLTRRRHSLGEDHPDALVSASNLAGDLRALGDYEAARQLDTDTLGRRQRVLGEDHLDTLRSANNLAADLRELGNYEAARQLDEDTLARRRHSLTNDHPSTLRSANNLAADLRELGNYEAARQLDEDTLARRRRVLGEDHPDTLTSANNLATDLDTLGED